MQITDIPFGITDWSTITPTEHKGDRGTAYWRTCEFGSLRVRLVEYSLGYVSNQWCMKGHIPLCLEGELHTRLQGGR